jgi:DNA-binding response OmpR family regulator
MTTSLHLPSRTLLIIDNDYHMLIGLHAFMERNGYKVITCNDSLSSIKMAEEIQPDLIVCDVMMPLMDGFKVRGELSINPLTSRIPFLFLSAQPIQSEKLRGLEIGANDYITKPFEPRELLARINTIFLRLEMGQ